MTLLLAAAAAAAAAWLITGGMRRYALRNAILDHPNDRSSHDVPTPRGGGVALVAVVLGAAAAASAAGALAPRTAAALLGGGAAVAAVGWVDDRRGVSAGARALVHFAAAIWAVAWLGGLPALETGLSALPLGPAGALLAVLGIVWSVNLYNFMDGIDGIAGVQAVTAGGAGGVLLALAGEAGAAAVALAAAGGALGFLAWNWAPAKIFMGDVGSGFLGFVFATLAVASENAGAVPLLVWIVLLGAFVADATITLARRALARERVHAAHRNHAYQRAVAGGWSHARVSTCVFVLGAALAGLGGVAWAHPRLLGGAAAVALALTAGAYLAVERRTPMRARRS